MAEITQNDEICKVLTCLPEKFVVDFANGIDVTQDHLRVQGSRGGIFPRLYDGLTGKGKRRQDEVNANLAQGVEGALTWLTELTGSVAKSNLALALVNDRVNALKENTASVAHYSADTRQRLEELAIQLNERCHKVEEELRRVDFTQRAALNLDAIFNRWKAGHFQHFSLAGRCYVVLEELRWKDFGDFCRAHAGSERAKTFQDDLRNRLVIQLAADLGQKPGGRLAMDEWLLQPQGRDVLADAQAALAYLGDGACVERQPFIFTVTQSPEQLSLEIPRLSSAERLGGALINEVFGAAYA